MTSPHGIPASRDDDTEDVAWALQTAETLWKRGERVDAIVWLRRAATAAGEAEADDRALALARAAAELSEWIAANPEVPSPSVAPSMAPADAGGVDDLLTVDVELVDAPPSGKLPAAEPSSMQPQVYRSVLDGTPSSEVPSAAEAHAGMLDPWAQEPAKEDAAPAAPTSTSVVADHTYDDEVITSAKLVTLAAQAHASTRKTKVETEAPKPKAAKPKPPKPAKPPPPVPKKPPPPVRPAMPTAPESPVARKPAPPTPIALEPEAEEATRVDQPSPVVDLPPMEMSVAPEPTLVSAAGTEARSPERTLPVVEVGGGEDVVTSVRIDVPVIPQISIPKPSAPIVAEPVPELAATPEPPPAPPAKPAVPRPATKPPPAPVAKVSEPPPPPPPVTKVSEPPPPPPPVAKVSEPPPPPPPAPAAAPEEVAPKIVVETPPPPAVDSSPRVVHLESVDALTDLPDDAREDLERTAELHHLGKDEEVMGFALAYLIEGEVDIAAQISDSPAERLTAGTVLKAKGSVAESVPLRLVAASERAVVATWTAEQVEPAFKACPWVEDELRDRANRVQALVGVTLGPLADHLDVDLRRQVTSRLALRELAEGAVEMEAGALVKELCIVGQGSLELVKDGEVVGTVGVGEVVFPQEIMGGGKATATVRGGKGGALLLVADRGVAQELMVTCPPLIEVFSAM